MAASKTATPSKAATPAKTTPSSGPSTADILQKAGSQYWAQTPGKLKAIDAFLAYVMLVGIIQFAVCHT
jgi:oligosaccharyltransferase complex subunit epsilon